MLAAMVGFAGVASAQYAPATLQKEFKDQLRKDKPGVSYAEKSAVIFSEDFANGLAGNNQLNGAWAATGANDLALFEYDTDGPEGAYTSQDQQVMSETVDNGVMMLNGDKVNTIDGVIATPLVVGNITAYLESPVIPLETREVALEFQHAFRWCCDNAAPYGIQVSFDAGASWSQHYLLTITQATNAGSGTLTESLFLGCYIPEGQDLSQFKFRFAHEGAGATSHYFWAIDDVKLVDFNLNSTQTIAGHHGDIVNDWDYEVIAHSQSHILDMGGQYLNNGSKSIDKFGSKIEVYNKAGELVNTTTKEISTLDVCIDSAIYRGTFAPGANEEYTVVYSATYSEYDQDPNHNDDTVITRFETAPDHFGHGSNWRGSAYVFDDDQGNNLEVEYGMIYRAYNPGVSTCMGIRTVFVNSGSLATTEGQFITFQLYQFLDPASPDTDAMELIADGEYEIPAEQLTTDVADVKWVDLYFDENQIEGIDLEQNQLYFVSITGYGGADALAVPTHGPDDDNAARAFGNLNNDGTFTWYGLASGVLVNMIIEGPLAVEEGAMTNSFELGVNVPNPVKNVTSIAYSNKVAGNVTMEVMDITGKVVAVVEEGVQAPGKHAINFDASQLANGVYTYTVEVNGERQTKRMVVSK